MAHTHFDSFTLFPTEIHDDVVSCLGILPTVLLAHKLTAKKLHGSMPEREQECQESASSEEGGGSHASKLGKPGNTSVENNVLSSFHHQATPGVAEGQTKESHAKQ